MSAQLIAGLGTLVFVIVVVTLLDRWELLKRFGPAFKGAPVDGTAQVLSVQELMGTSGTEDVVRERRCEIALRVQLPDRPPYDATIRRWVDVSAIPKLQPGATVVVAVDSANPQGVRIDFTQPIKPGGPPPIAI